MSSQTDLGQLNESELAQQMSAAQQQGGDVQPYIAELLRRLSQQRGQMSATYRQQQQQGQTVSTLQTQLANLTQQLTMMQAQQQQSQVQPVQSSVQQPRIKYDKPPMYDGNPAKLMNWIFLIKQYCTVMNLSSDVSKQQLASSRLEGRALTWWRTECFKDPQALTSWDLDDLILGLQSTFLDVDRDMKLRDRFDKLQQWTSVTAYTQAFRACLLEFGSACPDDATVLHHYMMGLKPAVRLEVLKSRPTLLADAEVIAERTDQALQLTKMGRSRPVTFPHPQPRPQQGPTPMEIDHVQQGPQTRSQGQQSEPNRSSAPRVPTSSGQQQKKVVCWHCGRAGHTRRECWKLQRQQQGQGQSVQQQRVSGVQQQPAPVADNPAVLRPKNQ